MYVLYVCYVCMYVCYVCMHYDIYASDFRICSYSDGLICVDTYYVTFQVINFKWFYLVIRRLPLLIIMIFNHHRVVKLLEKEIRGLLVYKTRQHFIMKVLGYQFTIVEAMVAGKYTSVYTYICTLHNYYCVFGIGEYSRVHNQFSYICVMSCIK